MSAVSIKCVECGATASLNDLEACSGWIVAPDVICPTCVAEAMKPQKKAKPRKLDGRRLANQRKAAKTPRRGAEFVIHGRIKSRKDPKIQDRIDMVVIAAKLMEQGITNHDVVKQYQANLQRLVAKTR